MNFKKKTMRAMMLGLATVLFAGFVSCSSSDDDDNKPLPPTPEPPTVEMTGVAFSINVEASPDELAMTDVTIEYLDEDGTTKTENITERKWSKTFNYTKFPADVAFTVKHSMKENVELTKEQYYCDIEVRPACYIMFSDSTTKASEEAYFASISKSISGKKKEHIADEVKKKDGVIMSSKYILKKSSSGKDVVAELVKL